MVVSGVNGSDPGAGLADSGQLPPLTSSAQLPRPAEEIAVGTRSAFAVNPRPGLAASGQLPPPEVLGGLPWRLLETHETEWNPSDVAPTLNIRLDGRIVPTAAPPGSARVSFSHLVVLDDFIGEPERAALMSFMTGLSAGPGSGEGGDTGGSEAAAAAEEGGNGTADSSAAGGGGGAGEADTGVMRSPGPRWERATADRAGLAATWGLKVRSEAPRHQGLGILG